MRLDGQYPLLLRQVCLRHLLLVDSAWTEQEERKSHLRDEDGVEEEETTRRLASST